MEKAYRVMRNSGAGNIAIGIILLVTGVTVGIISFNNGASLLNHNINISVPRIEVNPKLKLYFLN